MRIQDIVVWVSLVGTLVTAGMSYGRMTSALEDAQKEIALLRADMTAINSHFIMWASAHKEN